MLVSSGGLGPRAATEWLPQCVSSGVSSLSSAEPADHTLQFISATAGPGYTDPLPLPLPLTLTGCYLIADPVGGGAPSAYLAERGGCVAMRSFGLR